MYVRCMHACIYVCTLDGCIYVRGIYLSAAPLHCNTAGLTSSSVNNNYNIYICVCVYVCVC